MAESSPRGPPHPPGAGRRADTELQPASREIRGRHGPAPHGQSCGALAGDPRSAPPHGEAGPCTWATGLASGQSHTVGTRQAALSPAPDLHTMLVARRGFQLHVLLKGSSLRSQRGPHPRALPGDTASKFPKAE